MEMKIEYGKYELENSPGSLLVHAYWTGKYVENMEQTFPMVHENRPF